MLNDSQSPHLAGMVGNGSIDGVVLTPGAIPEPYRRQPEPTAGQGFSPGCDPELVARIVADTLVGKGAPDMDAIEARARAAAGH